VYPGPYDPRNGTAYPEPSPLYAVSVSFVFLNGTLAAPGQDAFVYFNSIGSHAPSPVPACNGWGRAYRGRHSPSTAPSSTPMSQSQQRFPSQRACCALRSYGLTCDATAGTSVARIRAPRSPLKVSVELYSVGGNSAAFVGQPLFLFPDPRRTGPRPVSERPRRAVLSRGVHNLSGQVALGCGTNNVYLEPGAFVFAALSTHVRAHRNARGGAGALGPLRVIGAASEEVTPGSLHLKDQVFSYFLQVIISGRGVASGEQFPWHSPLFSWALINVDAGTMNIVDGLVLVDSPEFHVASCSDRPTLRNLKMMSWTYNRCRGGVGRGVCVGARACTA